jgi:hypothetical protein
MMPNIPAFMLVNAVARELSRSVQKDVRIRVKKASRRSPAPDGRFAEEAT